MIAHEVHSGVGLGYDAVHITGPDKAILCKTSVVSLTQVTNRSFVVTMTTV